MAIWLGILLFVLGVIAGAVVGVTIKVTNILESEDGQEDED